MTTQQPFNASDHLINLKRKQRQTDGTWKEIDNPYLETRWRLVWLHDRYPDGASIVTELVEHKPEEYAVFKAQVAVDGKTATGWAIKRAGGNISYLENAETHALGRALAALGLGTQWCDDFDEGRDADGNVTPVDAPNGPKPVPVARVAPTNGHTAGGGVQERPATEPQLKAIYAIAKGSQAMREEEIEEWCRNRFGVLPGELSRRQASEAIDALKLGTAS